MSNTPANVKPCTSADPVAAGADDTVERLAGADQLRAAVGGDDLVDQGIDDRVGHAGEILRAFYRSCLRGEEVPQCTPGVVEK